MANKRKILQEESEQGSKRLRQSQNASTPLGNITILQHMPVSTSTPRRAMPRQGNGPSPLTLTLQYPLNSFNDSVWSVKSKTLQQNEANNTRNVSKQTKITEGFNKTNRLNVAKSKENVKIDTTAISNKSQKRSPRKNITENSQESNTEDTEKNTDVSVDDTASKGQQDFDNKSLTSERSNVLERSNLRRSERSVLSALSTTSGPNPMPITGQYPVHQSFSKSKNKSMAQKSVTEKSRTFKESKSGAAANQSKVTSFMSKKDTEPKVTKDQKDKSKSGLKSSDEDAEISQESQESLSHSVKSANKTRTKNPTPKKKATRAKANKTTGNVSTAKSKDQTDSAESQSDKESKRKSKTKGKPTKNKNLGRKKATGEEENVIQERARKTTKKIGRPKKKADLSSDADDHDDEAKKLSSNEKSKLSFSERIASKKGNQRYRNIKLSKKNLKQWKPISEQNIAYLSAVLKSNTQKTVYQCREKHQGDVQRFLSFYENVFIASVTNRDLPRSACKDYEKLELMIDETDTLDEEQDERLRDLEKAISREEKLLEEQEDKLKQLEDELAQRPSSEDNDEDESMLERTLEEDPLAKSINEKVHALIGDINSG